MPLTQMTAGILLHPVPSYPSPPFILPREPCTEDPNYPTTPIEISPYQPLSQIRSQPPSILVGEALKHQSLGPPKHQPLGKNLIQRIREQPQTDGPPPTMSHCHWQNGDRKKTLVTGGQAKPAPIPQPPLRDSPRRSISMEQGENPPMEPPFPSWGHTPAPDGAE